MRIEIEITLAADTMTIAGKETPLDGLGAYAWEEDTCSVNLYFPERMKAHRMLFAGNAECRGVVEALDEYLQVTV